VRHRYLRVLFVQAARVVLIRPQSWERYGIRAWIEAAKKRLHHNVLAIAPANKLARIAWAVLNKERNFEVTRTTGLRPSLHKGGTVLGAVKPWPADGRARTEATTTASLDGPCARCPARDGGPVFPAPANPGDPNGP
jgi:hypothetical protein